MFKRKQLQEQQESERRDLGLEREDLEGISSDSDSDIDENSYDDDEITDEEVLDENHNDPKSGPSKTKVMILGSRGINSRYFFSENFFILIL